MTAIEDSSIEAGLCHRFLLWCFGASAGFARDPSLDGIPKSGGNMLDDNRLERFRPDDDRMLRGYFRIPTSKDIQDAEPTCSHAAVDIALVRFCYIQGSSLRLRMQILPGYLLSANHGCKGRECCGEDRCLICFGGSPRRSSQQH